MQIAIIGGGASGMMAAAKLSQKKERLSVTIFERGERVGKKLLSTGNGRCNLSAAGSEERFASCYSNGGFCARVLSLAPPSMTLRFFHEMGLMTAAEGDGIYPYSFQASSVLDTLRMSIANGNVQECCNTEIAGIERRGKGFALKSNDGSVFSADKLIVSCGGQAGAKATGSLGLLQKLGHTVLRQIPALVPVKCEGEFLKGLNGLRAEAEVTLFFSGVRIASESGEVLFRDYGLSGIPVFQLSRVMAERIAHGEGKGEYSFVLDLFPGRADEAGKILKRRVAEIPKLSAAELFTGLVHRRIGENILSAGGESGTKEIAGVRLERVMEAAQKIQLKNLSLLPFDKAQVTAGGIATEEINADSMESKLIPGLYVTGEALDVTGRCGGYNLQWAWSTGYLAGSII